MIAAILYNPASGKGKAASVARTIFECLGPSRAALLATRPAPEPPITAHELAPAAAVIIAGGDGTLHAALPALVAHGAPIYHAPCGTENLFARHFGMSAHADAVGRALDARQTRRIDLGLLHAAGLFCPNRPFSLMASIGPDASIIHRLAAARRGPISHATYLPHIGAELLRPSLPRMRVVADGHALVTDRRGWLVVANAPNYARGINPAPSASMTDALLDVRFFPATNALAAAWWFLACRARRADARRGVICAAARHIEVALPPDEGGQPLAFVQADGDAVKLPAQPRDGPNLLTFTLQPGSLTVLLPAPGPP